MNFAVDISVIFLWRSWKTKNFPQYLTGFPEEFYSAFDSRREATKLIGLRNVP